MNIQPAYLLCLACLTVGLAASAQQTETTPPKITRVYLEHADVQLFDKTINADRQVLTGNVCFRHDSAYMYCDSAYFFEQNSSLEAFGTVRMEQGDTLFVFGNYLFYDGIRQLAMLREKVRMENVQPDSSIVTLFTDSLNYDRTTNTGYYFDGGMIVDADNQLTSLFGQYSPATKLAVFQDSVRLQNPQFDLYSDTLHYSVETKVASILGPSVIVSDSGTIHSSKGWYNTADNTSLLLDRSAIYSGDRMLMGDSIIYDRETGFGEAFGNIFLHDTLNKIILEGQYGYYNEKTAFAFATDSARCLEYSQGDTLYWHADTFEMTTLDSARRELRAYHHVRFFRSDLQGVCDSMLFDTQDMFTDPVLWSGEYQLYGDTIRAFMRDSAIDHVLVNRFAFAAQQIDSAAFNQMKGRDLYAYFEAKNVRMIYIDGSAETIFYPLEADQSMIGLNETRSSYLRIWFKDNKLEKLLIWPEPQAKMTPIPELAPDQRMLKDFHWYDYLRPADKDDIYRPTERKSADRPNNNNKFRNFAPES